MVGNFVRRLFILIVFLGAVPAHAETAALFQGENEREQTLIVLAESGDFVVQSSRDGYFLYLAGQGYWIEAGPGGPRATTAEALAHQQLADWESGVMLMASSEEDEPASTAFSAQGLVEIAGFSGILFTNEANWRPVVLSDDPALVPFGRAWSIYRQAIELGQPADMRDESNLAELLADRGILRMWDRDLVRVDPQYEAEELFILPDRVLTLDMALAAEPTAAATEDVDEAQFNPIVEAVYFDNALWTRDRDGGLQKWEEGGTSSVIQPVEGRVVDLCVFEGGLFTVRYEEESTHMQLLSFTAEGSTEIATWRANDHHPFLALDCSGSEIVLLTAAAIMFPQSGRELTIDPETLGPAGYFTTLQHDNWLYVGSNAGEWGGGLRRLSLQDGRDERIENDDGSLCGGLLNMNCDPVTGLANDPANPDCIIATIGLVHFLASGHVVRTCDTDITLAYRKPITLSTDWEWDPETASGEDFQSVPFFALASGARTVAAAGSDGLYYFTSESSEPRFEAFAPDARWPTGGVDWSDPEFVMIATTMNAAHSISGGSILLVPRN